MALRETWTNMACLWVSWQEMAELECADCAQERARRNRLVEPKDPRVKEPPFLEAPYVHQNNEPKYHALLVRAVEAAKRAENKPRHVVWVVAKDVPRNPEEFDVSPEQLQKKRCRWLQLHDQQTAGLPGLLPLYKGLRARVTERLSKKLHLFKHTPCTVVGWDLHPADKGTSQDGQRVLQYLPLCIYLKFEGVDWKLHSKLPAGVFPLKSVRRTWTVNKKTEAKAERRGFQLLPDYACTAHMVQGMTLLAMLADCGDLLDISQLKDMLASYVALSRVRAADGLLILRTFSRMLFKQGPPPGPHVLMKLLRARLNDNATSYTIEDALEEFSRLNDSWIQDKKLRKEAGQNWTCSSCSKTYPAEGFGASASNAGEVFA